jgi:hypothetical protein
MVFLLLIICAPLGILLLLKLVRVLVELRAQSAGYITFGGDDRYQARNVENYIHDSVMIARVQFEMSDEAFDAVIGRVQKNYLQWYYDLLSQIRHKPKGKTFQPPLEIWDEYRKYVLGDAPLLSQIVICKEEKIILLVGNHVYLGGQLLSQFVQLVFCETVSKEVFPRNTYIPVLTEFMMLTVLAKVMLRPIRQAIELFPDPSEIKRFCIHRDLAEFQATADEIKMSHLYVVIAEHVMMVMKHLGKDRLRVTLPVSFSGESSFNTIGGIFLDLKVAPDVQTMARTVRTQVRRHQWQASASNHIQRVLPLRQLSQRARNIVDLTLTMVPQKTLPHNILAEELETYEFTMSRIQYPVYIMVFIFEGMVHSSFMVNSPTFDSEGFVTQENAVPCDLRLDPR